MWELVKTFHIFQVYSASICVLSFLTISNSWRKLPGCSTSAESLNQINCWSAWSKIDPVRSFASARILRSALPPIPSGSLGNVHWVSIWPASCLILLPAISVASQRDWMILYGSFSNIVRALVSEVSDLSALLQISRGCHGCTASPDLSQVQACPWVSIDAHSSCWFTSISLSEKFSTNLAKLKVFPTLPASVAMACTSSTFSGV